MANTIKQEKLWGLTWFKGRTGAQDVAIENKKDNEIIVAYHSEKRGRAWACCPINQIEKLISTNRGQISPICGVIVS